MFGFDGLGSSRCGRDALAPGRNYPNVGGLLHGNYAEVGGIFGEGDLSLAICCLAPRLRFQRSFSKLTSTEPGLQSPGFYPALLLTLKRANKKLLDSRSVP